MNRSAVSSSIGSSSLNPSEGRSNVRLDDARVDGPGSPADIVTSVAVVVNDPEGIVAGDWGATSMDDGRTASESEG